MAVPESAVRRWQGGRHLAWLLIGLTGACGGGGGGGGSGAATSPLNAHSPIGINLNRFAYYNPEWVFVDAFRQASSWIPQEADSNVFSTGFPLTLDSNGWPILGTNPNGHPEAAGALLFKGIDGHYPAGDYVCLYDGTGTIELTGDAVETSIAPGRIEFTVAAPSNAGITLKLTASDSNDRVMNIRVVMPGFESTYQTHPFHPTFLAGLAHYKAIRFMDVQRTNDSIEQDWSNRTTLEWYTQADNGAGRNRGPAIEHLIDLCNELQAEPWFCIPHMATDDYVTQFATLVRDRLDPGLRIWIEYSNEVWNNLFGQQAWCGQEGFNRGYDVNNGMLAALRFQAARSVECFQIWENVFGSRDRLVRVLSGQTGNVSVGQIVMDWQDAYLSADVLAIAGYFGAPNATPQNAPGWTVADVLADLDNGIANTMQALDANLAQATQRGLKLVAYEGGQALVSTDALLQQLFADTNRDPGIHAPYLALLESWKAHGGGMFMHFASSSLYDQYGYWGLIEFQDQDTDSQAAAPKYRAVEDFIVANPVPDE